MRWTWLFVWTCALWGQTAPGGAIEGRTVTVDGRPLRGVLIRLQEDGATGKEPPTTNSDGDGRFRFSPVVPGRYRLMAERAGYLRQPFGGTAGEYGGGAVLEVGAGQTLSDVTIAMTVEARVLGTVTNMGGEPARGTQVNIYRRLAGGRPLLAGFASTDGYGAYKLTGVAPGSYVVCADPPRGLPGLPMPPGRGLDPAPTCYPNTTDVASAAKLEIGIGQEIRGIDIRLGASPAVTVRGKVTGEIPEESMTLQIQLQPVPLGGLSGGLGMTAVGRDGKFTIPAVRSGDYLLMLMVVKGWPRAVAAKKIHVENQDLNDVSIEFGSSGGGDVKGVVEVRGGKAVDLSKLAIAIVPAEGLVFGGGSITPDAEGRFVLSNPVPMKHMAIVLGMPDDVYLASASLGGKAYAPESIPLQDASGELVLTLASGAGRVHGSVNGGGGGLVTLIRDAGANPPWPRSAMNLVEASGRYGISQVAPGPYHAYAWQDPQQGRDPDPELLKKFVGKSVAVVVRENADLKVDLELITTAEMQKP